MKQSRLAQIAIVFVPGFAVAIGVLAWGYFLNPPSYKIPQWQGTWSEPKQPEGTYKSWRVEGGANGAVIGETEPWPHKHPRANSFLLSSESYSGDVLVEIQASFLRGRYLGCYLCYDPQTDSGYWLSTGHGVGNYPNQAYIKIVRNGDWKTMARAPLEIEPGKTYRLGYRRRGNELAVLVAGQPVVTWRDDTFNSGKVQLRLHNTKVEITDLKVTKPGSSE